jgi:hypothetical protein
MAIGTIGNIRPSDVNIEDIEIIYTFSPNRQTEPTVIGTLDAEDIISEINLEDDTLVNGLYNIRLDPETFDQVGIYNIYIKPKEYKLKISNCGVLSTISSVRGVIINGNDISGISTRFANNGLVGYRIEYFDSEGNKIRNLFRVITSSNRCLPEEGNNNSPQQTSTRYRFSDSESSNLVFLTVTPSTPTNVRPNLIPYIGSPNQDIVITNTFFSPILLEVELTEHDIETLALGIYGDQSKSKIDGILTYYDKDGNIYKQFDVFETENAEGVIDYEVKLERDSIDTSKDLGDILNEE